MAVVLKEMRKRSIKRRELLAQQFGITNPAILPKLLNSKEELDSRRAERHLYLNSSAGAVNKYRIDDFNRNLPRSSDAGVRKEGEEADKEEVYTDSSAFLKGTQSANPHNDYCQNFVDKCERPQNFIRDVGLTNRFEEYPKLRELILLKDELVQNTNTPPMYGEYENQNEMTEDNARMYLKCDLDTFDLRDLEAKFDVILIEPPLEEYQRTVGLTCDKFWNWDEIEKLDIDSIAAQRSFIWIWCGSSDGLDAGRRCLRTWGYRRCEDICWIKTNIKNPGHTKILEPKAIFQRTKEHCLMGIKGTVRRSTDGDFIHANVDIDLVIAEEEKWGSDEKPVEIFHIIEHFCLGRRRLHIFGRDTTIRPGWLTIGPRLTSSNFDSEVYNSYFTKEPNGYLAVCTEEIERLRPKSPPAKTKPGGGGMGGGIGPGGGGPSPSMQRGGGGLRMGGMQRGGGGMPGRGGGGGGMMQTRLAPPPRNSMPPPQMNRGGGGPGMIGSGGGGWTPRAGGAFQRGGGSVGGWNNNPMLPPR